MRSEVREPLTLEMCMLDGSTASTRDVSALGMYFVMATSTPIARRVQVELVLPGDALMFCAEAEIVRLEYTPEGTGVAVRLHGSRLVPVR